MAAMDFPANPTNGQVYGNYVYSTATGAWNAKPLTGQKAVVSATAPSAPSMGDEWFNSNDGNLYVYYTDVDGSQWVQVKSDATLSSTLGSRVDALDYGANVNYVINGAMDFWQRGTSFTGISNGTYTADRWAVGKDGTATINVSQQSFTPGSAPVPGYEGTYFLRFNVSAWTSSDCYMVHRIEDVRTLAGQTATVSYWAKAASNVTTTGYLTQNFGSGGSSVVVTSIGTANITTSWQRFTHVVTIPSISGKTIGANNLIELQIARFASANTVDIWGVQVQQGVTATAFHRNANSIQAELAACHRYFRRYTSGGDDIMWNGTWYEANALWVPMIFPTPMRAKPVVSYSGTPQTYGGGGNVPITGIDEYAGGVPTATGGVYVFRNAGGNTVGRSGFVGLSGAGNYIQFNAEL